MGQDANFITAATLTGVSKREDIAQMPNPPDDVIASLSDFLAVVK